MTLFNTLIAIVAMISLFLFSLRGFSKQLQKLGAERMKIWLGKITRNRFSGLLLGAVITAVIQSSSAVSSITIALVDSGVITFYNSLAVLLGTNLGTTFTAWLVTFKLDFLGSYLLIMGTIIGFLPHRVHIAGKSIFYLGLILFSLQLISQALDPLKASEEMLAILAVSATPVIGVLVGTFATALVQSSSVITGLTIILAGQGLLPLEGAIAIVVGSNLGTTSTALIASVSLNRSARLAAIANFIFNLIGLLFVLPFLKYFITLIAKFDSDITIQVATAHLIFNFVVAILTFPFLNHIGAWVEKITRSKDVKTSI
jgi:phosphate:Na+ symporter